MRFVIGSVKGIQEWSGDDSEFRDLQESLLELLDDEPAPAAPPRATQPQAPRATHRRELLPLLALIALP